MNLSNPVLINGLPTDQIGIADRGFQYGDGVFTTLAVADQVPILLPRHLRRLQGDCARLALPRPDLSLLAREAKELCRGRTAGVLKIVLTRGAGGRGYGAPAEPKLTRVLSLHPAPAFPAGLAMTGIRARVCAMRLGHNVRLAGVKHLNRLEQVLARAEWDEEDIREGIVLDQEGWVVEGVMSNLFALKSGRLLTPLLDRCGVAGVMRELLMETARELGWMVEETRLGLAELREAEELFLTNSVIRLWPIRQLDEQWFPVRQSAGLAERLEQAIAGERGSTCPV